MRIAEILDTLSIGGAERMALDLAMSLEARGHRTCFVCIRKSGALAEIAKEAGIEVIALGKDEGFSPRLVGQLADCLKSHNIDVVHTHNPLVHHYGILAGRLAGTPAIVNTIHGINNFSVRPGKREILYGLSSYFTDRIVTVCAEANDFFRARTIFPSKKLTVIDNGIPLDSFLRVPAARVKDRFAFGAVGRLVPIKDHILLLKAFVIVHAKYPKCRLDILGDGPLRAELDKAVGELGLFEHVRLRGASTDVAAFLAELDVFVMSSLSEGLPLTMLEAMASGLPVVSTDVGGIGNLLGEANCGWLCPPGDSSQLAQAMITAVESEQKVDFGARARRLIVERYSLTRMTEQYEQLFAQILTTKQRGISWN